MLGALLDEDRKEPGNGAARRAALHLALLSVYTLRTEENLAIPYFGQMTVT